MASFGPIVYRIDQHAEIVFVNRAWEQFASENAGASASASAVLHQSLWDFVQGESLRGLYHQVVERARRGSSLTFPFRCDSPSQKRWFEMQVAPVEGGLVEFRSTLIREELRRTTHSLETSSEPSDASVEACSVCLKLRDGDQWMSLEDLIAKRPIMEGEDSACLHHGVCDSCFEQMRTAVEQS